MTAGGRLADGQFAVPRAEVALAFTGERMTTEMEGQIAFEHFHRYSLARDHCVGRDVLDVAAGEGYGAALLAGVARSVVGIEIDPASVLHAAHAYRRDNLRFAAGDAIALPLADACVDVVVSFETLEHLSDQEAFLGEVKRVLRPGGLLLVSTPDRLVYSAPGEPANPYHVLELTPVEFDTLLGRHFAHHRILGQRTILGSVMAPLGDGDGWRSYDRRSDAVIEAQPGLSRAFYLIAAASDAPLPALGSSVYAQNASIDDLFHAQAALPLQREAADAEREAARQRQGALDSELTTTRATLAAAQRQAAELSAVIESIRVSTLWRLTAPLRVLARQFPALGRLGASVVRVAFWSLTFQLPARLAERRAYRASLAGLAPGGEDLRVALKLPPAIDPVPDPASIALPPMTDTPRVSIIIPTYGQVDHALRCLASLAAAPPAVAFEVLLVDDASGDPRVASLAQVRGIRFTQRTQNLGFLRSCNAAAAEARGAFLFFLNDDTEVMPGAIDALVRLLEARPDAGMVGARLLYPDGVQQEAGGIMWRDGTGWNYGNRDDPRKPEYNYVREVDYVSGAAIMLPHARWTEMGGFDEHFLPAYCEDSDLAFRLRAAGWKVLYQPQAMVIHHEGASHGTDTRSGVKAHQVTNTHKLLVRWRETLEREAFAPGQRILRARDRAGDRHLGHPAGHPVGRKVTLVIDHYIPEPDRDAGSRTMLAFIDALLATGRVVKFFPANLYPTPGYLEALQQRGVEVLYRPWVSDFTSWIAANGAEVDEVLLSRPGIAVEMLGPLRAHCRAPIVFYGHDLHFARMRLQPGAMHNPLKREAIEQMQELERRTWRMVDQVLYPSEEEAAQVRALEPGVRAQAIAAYALPPPIVPQAAPPEASVIFVAGFRHQPNVDAALWLAKDILPLLRRALPGTRLVLAGSNPPPEVLALAGEGVEVTGFISDEELARRYATARVSLCALRVGAGVKLKVVEAMHAGVPVVTTSVGAQGLPGLAEVCDIVDTAAGLAEATLRLLRDDTLWLERAQAQTGYVAAHFSVAAMQAALVAIFASVEPTR